MAARGAVSQFARHATAAPENSRMLAFIEAQVRGCPVRCPSQAQCVGVSSTAVTYAGHTIAMAGARWARSVSPSRCACSSSHRTSSSCPRAARATKSWCAAARPEWRERTRTSLELNQHCAPRAAMQYRLYLFNDAVMVARPDRASEARAPSTADQVRSRVGNAAVLWCCQSC